ncbi:fatty acid desaturase [Myxococcaceae bacterium GXIMD 01537]
MPPPRPGAPPALDLPNLAVHALWWMWFVALLRTWDGLPVWARGAMLALGAGVVFWNYAVLHNHMHVPVATAPPLRWLVSRTLGLACGFAYRGYYLHHFNHHRYNGGPGDWGQRPSGEGALRYCLRWTLTPWLRPRAILPRVWRAARTPRHRAELLLDLLVVDGALVALALWRPALGGGYWLTVLTAQFGIYWLNLAAHAGTDPSDRLRLAVTSTSRLYNTFVFNAGYHQEHHRWPQRPWRDLAQLTRDSEEAGRIPPELKTPLSPINPRWVAWVVRGYRPSPCDRQTGSTTTAATPTGDT